MECFISGRYRQVSVSTGLTVHISFTDQQCLNYEKLKFRPLFFRDELTSSPMNSPLYDLAFIGSMHSDRLQIIRNLEKIAQAQNWSTYFYLYIGPGLKTYFKEFLKNNTKHLHTRPLRYKSVQDKLLSSRAILDFHNPLQSGLTMRTIEALAQGKKIITSNVDIKNYDFFSDENILVIDTNTLKIDVDFIRSDFKKIPSDILDKYSLQGWIKDIFGSTGIPVALRSSA